MNESSVFIIILELLLIITSSFNSKIMLRSTDKLRQQGINGEILIEDELAVRFGLTDSQCAESCRATPGSRAAILIGDACRCFGQEHCEQVKG